MAAANQCKQGFQKNLEGKVPVNSTTTGPCGTNGTTWQKCPHCHCVSERFQDWLCLLDSLLNLLLDAGRCTSVSSQKRCWNKIRIPIAFSIRFLNSMGDHRTAELSINSGLIYSHWMRSKARSSDWWNQRHSPGIPWPVGQTVWEETWNPERTIWTYHICMCGLYHALQSVSFPC